MARLPPDAHTTSDECRSAHASQRTQVAISPSRNTPKATAWPNSALSQARTSSAPTMASPDASLSSSRCQIVGMFFDAPLAKVPPKKLFLRSVFKVAERRRGDLERQASLSAIAIPQNRPHSDAQNSDIPESGVLFRQLIGDEFVDRVLLRPDRK